MPQLNKIKLKIKKYLVVLVSGISVISCGGGGGGSDTPVVVLDVIANNDVYSVNKNFVLNVSASSGVLSNDTGLTGLTYSLSLAERPANGALSLSNDGSFSYIPETDFSGTDSFTYRILNDSINKTAVVNITVVHEIMANDDNYTVDKNLVLNVTALMGVLSNDTGLAGQTLSLSPTANPANGTLSISNDGAFTYTPNTDFVGIDSFTYRLFNESVNTTAVVSIDVLETNTPPLANANAYTTNEDSPLILDAASGLLGNDSDIDNDILTAILVPGSGPNNGTLVLNNNGSLSYTPDPDFHGSDSFSYVANDGTTDGNIAAVNLTLNSLNDIPTFSAGGNQLILEDDGIQSVIGWATGMNTGAVNESTQILSFNVTNDNTPLFAVQPAIDAITGNLTYTPVANANGRAIVTVLLSDDGGTTNGGIDTSTAQAFTIDIASVNDSPSFTKGIDQTILEDAGSQTVIGWATGISTGPANENTQTILGFTVDNDSNPLFSVQPFITQTGDLSYTPADNAHGLAIVTVRVSDDGGTANGGSDTSGIETFSISITSQEDDPTITTLPETSALPGLNYIYDVDTFDPDGDLITYELDATSLTLGINIDTNSGLISWIPTNLNIGSSTVTVTATDSTNRADTQSFTLTVGFSDDFNDGNLNGWSIIDDALNTSNWQVTGGELTQLNYVEEIATGTPFDESYHLGTYAVFDSGFNLSNYRVSVDITPMLNNLTTDEVEGNSLGILFRYQDDNNYYRLTTNARYGFSRLEKRISGVFTTLAINSRGYIENQMNNITIEINGALILVYLDNDPLFSISDTTFSTGSIALFNQDKSKFDNVLVQGVKTTPSIILSKPLAHSVETTDTLNVEALVTNAPAGSWVEFLLDGSESLIDTTQPFSGQFTTVAQENHIVEAILHDSSSEIIRDTNINVGAQGNYYVGVGDSITNGIKDNYQTDNQSADGRNISSQGYQANIIDLLNTSGASPSIIFNDGIGGDSTTDTLNTRINSILERHIDANNYLILLGTNDSSSVASGSGCSGAACNGTFKGNMQSIVDLIIADGKQVTVALIPPSWGSPLFANPWTASRNITIREYNSVINSELTDISIGPDFFSFFLDDTNSDNTPDIVRSSLFEDSLHPNGLGYVVMAHLWHNFLNPISPVAIPFILEDVSRSIYKQNLIEVGDIFYIDEIHKITSVPPALINGRWIMTANSDANNTSTNFLSFTVDRNVDVYIAYDSGTTPPNWMNGYSVTGIQISTENPSAPTMDLYKASSGAGTIALGGNNAPGASGSNANYLVIVVEK